MAAKPKAKGRSRSGTIEVAPPRGDSESLRIREISNGFIITREGSKRGKYFSHEEFSPGKPTITAGVPAKPTRRGA